MKDLRVVVYRSFNKMFVIAGLLVADFVSVVASDELLHTSFTTQTTDESLSDDSFDDALDVEAYFQEDFENCTSSSSDFPVTSSFSTKNYDNDDIYLRDGLIEAMNYILFSLTDPERSSDDWLREINPSNTKNMDLCLQGRIIPGTKKTQLTAILQVVPLDDVDVENVFPPKIKKIKDRFAQFEIDLDVQLYPYKNVQNLHTRFNK